MKKVCTLILMLLMFVGYTSAQESEDVYYLGYCNGEINSLGTGKSGECIVSAAIMIPKEDLVRLLLMVIGITLWFCLAGKLILPE